MLSEITIENVAVIEKACAGFGDGFTVLTGETGAGKSILIDSINAILGNRTSKDIVRSGAAKAGIWASFDRIPESTAGYLAQAGYDGSAELLLNREVSAEGKSTCRINGTPATAAMLREICGGLVNIHGQHDNQSLLNPAKHMGVLDAFAQNDALRGEYGVVYAEWRRLRGEIQALSLDEAEKARKIELLRFEVEEIEGANLKPGEEEQLLEQRNMMRNAQRLVDAMNRAGAALNGDEDSGGASVLLADAAREMRSIASIANIYAEYADKLDEIYYIITELSSDIQGRLTGLEYGSLEIEAVEARLDALYRLKQRYGQTVEDVIAHGARAAEQLEAIELSAERLTALAQQEAQALQALGKLADGLTVSRREAFEKLNVEIADALEFLNMPGIRMALDIKKVEYGPQGQDTVEFFIATNPGEAPKPLAKIASGGELARIMLALKSALADRDDVPTVIYDEIDTGVSGMAAGRIGKLLRQTAAGRQVICVTHTAQIAAYAQRHLLIEKSVVDGRTYTNIRQLDEAERIDELARIISGDKVTDIARANAQEMLRMAEEQ